MSATSTFSIEEFGTLSRDQLVYLARTAEASERFEGTPGAEDGTGNVAKPDLKSPTRAPYWFPALAT